MTKEVGDEQVRFILEKSEAVVLFEWLSRNWEGSSWEIEGLFVDAAEKVVLMRLESKLAKDLTEPFDDDYLNVVKRYYREILPDPGDLE